MLSFGRSRAVDKAKCHSKNWKSIIDSFLNTFCNFLLLFFNHLHSSDFFCSGRVLTLVIMQFFAPNFHHGVERTATVFQMFRWRLWVFFISFMSIPEMRSITITSAGYSHWFTYLFSQFSDRKRTTYLGICLI